MHETSTSNELPPIPSKRYFTIGEVADLCGVKPHVLRYWEQEFGELNPVKRRGNRRYYQQEDVLLIRKIRGLLYDQGFTIGGARQQLSAPTKERRPRLDGRERQKQLVREMRGELEQILDMLGQDAESPEHGGSRPFD
mgnify:CR=1 FL=1